MFGSQFMGKALIVMCALPLLAHADIDLDMKPLSRYVSKQATGVADDKTAEQIKAAAESLAMSAQMNATAHQVYTGKSGGDYVQDEQFQKIMGNLNNLATQSALNE